MEKNQLDICGHPFVVRATETDDTFADCEPITGVIRFNKNATIRRIGEAIFHEAGHSFAPTMSETPMGHSLWDVLSAQGWQFLWDNGFINEDRIKQLLD